MRRADEVNPALVRAYDLRGQVGRELTEADARALGRRYAAALLARGGRRVAVGYDGRVSSPMLETALVAGLVAGGAAVERIGCGPTGMLYFAVHERALDGGIMVTGSHNPADQNGFKLLLGTEPVYGAALRAMVLGEGVLNRAVAVEMVPERVPNPVRAELVEALPFFAPAEQDGPSTSSGRTGAGEAPSRSVRAELVEAQATWRTRAELVDISAAYTARLLRAAAEAPALRVGWDPGNGATGDVLARVVAELPGEHHIINGAVDGTFPAHHPDPSVPENLAQLQALVRERGLDLGIAFDGDGDRIGVVDASGEIVWPDQLLLFLAQDVLARRPGAAVVADVKSSRVLFDGVATAGGRGVLSPSGYVLIRAAMLREGAPLAGEMSGHLFFAEDWYGTDDALHVAMRVLAAIGRRGSVTAFRDGLPRTWATPELRLPCPDTDKARVLAAVAEALAAEGAEVDRTDGLRVTTPDGWWLLRDSGTEPKLTARVEAWSEAGLERLQGELTGRLEGAGVGSA